MAIATLNDLVGAMAAATRQLRPIAKISIANTGAGEMFNTFRSSNVPVGASIPGAAAVLDNTSTGAVPYVNPTGGKSGYLAGFAVSSNVAGIGIEIWDRLSHMGGLDGTSVGVQTVGVDCTVGTSNMAARKGAADYSDVSWFVNIFTDIGTSAQTATITYTSGAGTPGQTTTVSVGGASPLNRANRLIPIFTGNNNTIRSIESLQLGGSTGTAGNFGVVAVRRLAMVPTAIANFATYHDWNVMGLPKLEDSVCLDFGIWCAGTSAGTINGTLLLLHG